MIEILRNVSPGVCKSLPNRLPPCYGWNSAQGGLQLVILGQHLREIKDEIALP